MVTPDKKIDSRSAEVVRSFIATWNTHDTSATMDLLDPDIVFVRYPLLAQALLAGASGQLRNMATTDGNWREDRSTGRSTWPDQLSGSPLIY